MQVARRTRRAPAASIALLAIGVLGGILANAQAITSTAATLTSPTTISTTTSLPSTTATTPARTTPSTVVQKATLTSTACALGPVPATTTTTTAPTTTTITPTTIAPTTTTIPLTTTSSTTTLPGAPMTTTTTTTTTIAPTTTTATTTTTIPTAPTTQNAYDLLGSDGSVTPFGGAATSGSKAGVLLPAAIIGGGATNDGGGYWIVSAKGNVYNYGDALYYGAPVHTRLGGPIVGFGVTPDSQGYWLLDRNGAVYNYGDADFCGSAVHAHAKRPFIAFAATADGLGYYLVTTSGIVYAYGDAATRYSVARQAPRRHITSIAVDPLGGYWLANAKGAIYPFSGATFYGSPIHQKLRVPVTSIVASASGLGYFDTTSNGRIFNYGDAPFYGSDAHSRPKGRTRIVALIRTAAVPTASVPGLPHHVVGYDISNFQCAKPGSPNIGNGLPPQSSFTAIEAAGWLDSAHNSCLQAEAAWATQAAGVSATPYDLYLFLNAPDTSSTATAYGSTGPGGNCVVMAAGATKLQCVAYNYAYNGARNAFNYATGLKVASSLWWLDVENPNLSPSAYSNFAAGQFWSYSPTLNAAPLQGAIDGLRSEGVLVGIYSTSVQYPKIVGAYVPTGARVPIWIAGAPWTSPPYAQAGLAPMSVLSAWCAGTASYTGIPPVNVLFANGVPWLLQETPGTEKSPYNLDPNYTC